MTDKTRKRELDMALLGMALSALEAWGFSQEERAWAVGYNTSGGDTPADFACFVGMAFRVSLDSQKRVEMIIAIKMSLETMFRESPTVQRERLETPHPAMCGRSPKAMMVAEYPDLVTVRDYLCDPAK